MVMNQAGANALDLVGTDCRADTAATNRQPAIDLPRHHRLRERNDEVRIIVIRRQGVGSEIHDLVAGRAELRKQLLFQTKATMIRRDSYAHNFSSIASWPLTTGSCQPPKGVTRSTSVGPHVCGS